MACLVVFKIINQTGCSHPNGFQGVGVASVKSLGPFSPEKKIAITLTSPPFNQPTNESTNHPSSNKLNEPHHQSTNQSHQVTDKSKAAASKSLSDCPGTIQPKSAKCPLLAELQSECAWQNLGVWEGWLQCWEYVVIYIYIYPTVLFPWFIC